MPPVDVGGLGGAVGGAELVRRLAESTHAAVVRGHRPRVAASRRDVARPGGGAHSLRNSQGVAVDIDRRRPSAGRQGESLPEMGQILFRDHVIFEPERRPEAPALVTRGMDKFGLPDLVLRGVPDDLRCEAEVLLVYLASQLARWAAVLRMVSNGRPVQAKLNSTCQLTTAQILAAHAVDPSDLWVNPSERDDIALRKCGRCQSGFLDFGSFPWADGTATPRRRSAAWSPSSSSHPRMTSNSQATSPARATTAP